MCYGLQKFVPPHFRFGFDEDSSNSAQGRAIHKRVEVTDPSFFSYGGWLVTVFSKTERGATFMDLEVAATNAAETVTKLVDGYREKLKGLKSDLQNDSASIKASAERIEKEFARVAASVANVSSVLTSPQFAEALANAERLAAALAAIQSLGSGSIAFHVQGASDTDE